MSLEACLPEHLRGAPITKIAGGLSGAGVYRVGAAHVLKISEAPLEAWRQALAIQRAAGDAGLAPRVIHHDEARRAVVSEQVVAQRAMFDAKRFGELIRRVHALPLPAGAVRREPRDSIPPAPATFAIPHFARAAIDRVFAETPPPPRALVTSHNDMNPSNLAFDGERMLLIDWDMAGPNDPFFDLGTVALFWRLDDEAASALIAAYDGAPPAALPDGFRYARRFVAALCSTIFFRLAHHAGHPGGEVAAEQAPTLRDVHALIGSGTLAPNSADGAWAFALALAKAI